MSFILRLESGGAEAVDSTLDEAVERAKRIIHDSSGTCRRIEIENSAGILIYVVSQTTVSRRLNEGDGHGWKTEKYLMPKGYFAILPDDLSSDVIRDRSSPVLVWSGRGRWDVLVWNEDRKRWEHQDGTQYRYLIQRFAYLR